MGIELEAWNLREIEMSEATKPRGNGGGRRGRLGVSAAVVFLDGRGRDESTKPRIGRKVRGVSQVVLQRVQKGKSFVQEFCAGRAVPSLARDIWCHFRSPMT
jgi:hypothetical protein